MRTNSVCACAMLWDIMVAASSKPPNGRRGCVRYPNLTDRLAQSIRLHTTPSTGSSDKPDRQHTQRSSAIAAAAAGHVPAHTPPSTSKNTMAGAVGSGPKGALQAAVVICLYVLGMVAAGSLLLVCVRCLGMDVLRAGWHTSIDTSTAHHQPNQNPHTQRTAWRARATRAWGCAASRSRPATARWTPRPPRSAAGASPLCVD